MVTGGTPRCELLLLLLFRPEPDDDDEAGAPDEVELRPEVPLVTLGLCGTPCGLAGRSFE